MNKEALIQLMELMEELSKELKDPRMVVLFRDNCLHLQFVIEDGSVHKRWTKCISKEDLLSRFAFWQSAEDIIELFTVNRRNSKCNT